MPPFSRQVEGKFIFSNVYKEKQAGKQQEIESFYVQPKPRTKRFND
jgi:hypothetical protein